MDEKLLYIQNILTTKQDTDFFSALYTFIIKYDLEHSTNSNGIFLNLSVIDKDIIDEMYEYIVNMNTTTDDYKDNTLLLQNMNENIKEKEEFTLIKDKLSLEKFDKRLLELSTRHISI